MHTYLYRLNALFTVASTALAVICAATALTDWTFKPSPSVDLKIKSFDGLQVRVHQAMLPYISFVPRVSACCASCAGKHRCMPDAGAPKRACPPDSLLSMAHCSLACKLCS